VAESEVPTTIDGSQDLIFSLSFPDRGFKRGSFDVQSARVKVVVDAYVMVGRSDAANLLRSKLAEIEDGFSTCDSDVLQLMTNSGSSDLLRQTLQRNLGNDYGAVLKKDATGRSRILFNVADTVLKPDYVTVVNVPAHRARQVSEILDATKDLRDRWDSVAEGVGLSLGQGSPFFGER